jgi:hypothetical protein
MYNDADWEQWAAKIECDFKPKKYDHFDHKFNFPARKKELQKIISKPEVIKAHSFLPLLKIVIKTPRYRYIEKKRKFGLETKKRPIAYASHLDTYIYAYYAFLLNKRYQGYIRLRGFNRAVLAYRSDLDGQCNIQFSKEVFNYVRQKGECTAIALDIKGYFDHIDHKILKEKWAKILGKNELPEDQYAVFRSLTCYSYVNKNSFLRHFSLKLRELPKKPTLLDYMDGRSFREKMASLRSENLITRNEAHELLPDGYKRYYGIPQGLAISALLSNVYLIDYDLWWQQKAEQEGFLYRRYCDDILIVCETKRALELQKEAIHKISEYHLDIQEKKVELIAFRKNSKGKIRAFNLKKIREEKPAKLSVANEQRYYKSLQYLGFEFNGQNVFIRAGSISRYHRKASGRIIKTVCMAYSEHGKGDRIFKQQLYHRYTHLGNRNFLHYSYNAAKKYYINSAGLRKDSMGSSAIRWQVRKHMDIIQYKLGSKNLQRALHKAYKGKLKKLKRA